MLAQFYGFVLVNSTGDLMTFNDGASVTLKVTGAYVHPSTGKIAYDQFTDTDMGFGGGDTLADSAELASAEYDNRSDLYLNALVQIEVAHDQGGLASGTLDLYYVAGDASGELEYNASGYLSARANKLTFIGSLIWASAFDDELLRSEVWLV